MLSKEVLIQYTDLQKEMQELRTQIDKLENQISKIKKDGTVKDSVKGGSGGIQHFIVEGFPIPELNKKTKLLAERRARLQLREIKLLETLNEVEEFIESVPDSYMRRIINLRIVENLTWQQVANRLGGVNTETGIKSAFHRFMEKN